MDDTQKNKTKVEIINTRKKKIRFINPFEKQIIVFNTTLNEFQLLQTVSSSYDEDCEVKNK